MEAPQMTLRYFDYDAVLLDRTYMAAVEVQQTFLLKSLIYNVMLSWLRRQNSTPTLIPPARQAIEFSLENTE